VTAPLRILIADDEPLGRRRLAQAVSQARDVVLVGEARSGSEALELIDALEPDIVLLDILMPGLSGVEVCAAAAEHAATAFVFVTAHERFARQAFDVAAVDYLLKPFGMPRFNQALARAAQFCADRRRSLSIAAATPMLGELWIVDRSGRRRVETAMIDWIAAERDYSRIHIGAESLLHHQSLVRLQAQLDPAAFARVHRSAIVRLGAVRRIAHSANGKIELVTASPFPVPVGRRHRARLNRWLRSIDEAGLPPRVS